MSTRRRGLLADPEVMIQLQQGVLIGRAPWGGEGGGQGGLARGQAVEHVAYHGGWGVGLHLQRLGQGPDGELVAVHAVTGGWAGAAITLGTVVGAKLQPCLILPEALLGSSLWLAGRFTTSQCHQPLPVGASGS